MSKHALLLAAALTLAAPLLGLSPGRQRPRSWSTPSSCPATGPSPATTSTMACSLAFKEINAAGGILGRQIDVVPLDIETKPEVAKAALRKAAELQAFAMMGPVFSDMVLATMEDIRAAERPTFVGAEAASITAQGNPYLFRTSLSQAASMPKLARYLKDGLRVESVAMVWVDNAFGRGGHEAMTKALAAEGIAVAADLMTVAGAARLRRGRGQGPRLGCRRRLRLPQRARGGGLPAGAVRRGLWRLDRRRDDACRAKRDRHGGLCRQRGAGPCRPHPRRPGARASRDFANRFLQEYKYEQRPQRHEGLHRRPRAQGGHREGRLLRSQGRSPQAMKGISLDRCRASGRAARREVRRQGRSRPRQLHRPGQRPTSGDDRRPAGGRRRVLGRLGSPRR